MINAKNWRISMRGDERCIVDDAGVVAVVFGDDPTEARAILAAVKNPAEYFAAYCDKRSAEAGAPTNREWWSRMAGNARKAATL